ncbi:anti-phage dCTP deaminase [Shewanella sp. UCD-KL21]|uniref:anti-phage dCTP deaminase n=1 Tax=Shewanella sp. UCD-KL21 TaxID=1917164 RepID=UPI000970FD44|nr:anti-phage dCTP deaminase [Shewanella sp. UCD-KL21]USN27059.1 deaminase [synthetic construct]
MAQPQLVNFPGKKSKSTLDTIRARHSKELVIGLCGAVGAGVKLLNKQLQEELIAADYHVEHISLSELIAAQFDNPEETLKLNGYERYEKLQDLGDDLRTNKSPSIVADMAIRRISIIRTTLFGDKTQNPTTALKIDKKVAYIINQLKNPAEVKIFQEIYRNNFYLLGLLRTENERINNIVQEGIKKSDAYKLVDRDRKGKDDFGQQVESTAFLSDYFIRNIDKADKLKASVTRFIKLVHGVENITPTRNESGMFSAYSASLRSACMSRQVGAAISDTEGRILSTGCNDVPKFGGGLYDTDNEEDNRCYGYRAGDCHNDKHKDLLKKQIEEVLTKNGIDNSTKLAADIMDNSKAKSLIEYSRAIHAEMDAIVSLARDTTTSTVGKILYCTTYPCHSCARHIVAAGIERVVYIEPYEKSLALDLHDDAICLIDDKKANKVVFENFEGVSPNRYSKFFAYSKKKKKNGKAIEFNLIKEEHMDTQPLDCYGDYELKVVEMTNELVGEDSFIQ